MYEQLVGPDVPVAFQGYDGSHAGPSDAVATIVIREPIALNYLATGLKGGIGLARAYVTGAIDVTGDLYSGLRALWTRVPSVSKAQAIAIFSKLGGLKLLKRPPLPPGEARLSGRTHSRQRDAAAIAHHYDVSNAFYELILGPSMAYTCAVYPTEVATLEQAQFEKHDLVARKLGLKSGMRLLDVGCGWGGMVMHAAREYGVKALGVTLSKQQATWAQEKIKSEGLEDLAEVRFMDYRDAAETDFDAISSIGLTEHIGRAQQASYFRSLYDKLKPGGRLLNHTITHPHGNFPPNERGGFITRYIFPDGELSGPGVLMSHIHDVGFEVRHSENLREHYAMTLRAWWANLKANWEAAVAEVGEQTARAWLLYLVGSQLGFETNGIELHQFLAVRLDDDADAHMPLRPNWGS
ncbi:cyclopropane-fatty-acyl-phospholipid synthase [Actinorhabdospora filicis]|uniref:Cyclopropane-fatty-acyl-phospholipid synthase n=1 Tax=Actinorhabdospora filicis TaxID=1785913 RepID=A0A9W6SGD7_9ACTN|nr:cyclopropane-fatty-acyl-phospholipid synthase [Actinorhabdospora filicis]